MHDVQCENILKRPISISRSICLYGFLTTQNKAQLRNTIYIKVCSTNGNKKQTCLWNQCCIYFPADIANSLYIQCEIIRYAISHIITQTKQDKHFTKYHQKSPSKKLSKVLTITGLLLKSALNGGKKRQIKGTIWAPINV